MLTQTQLSTKRAERNAASRAKAKAKARRYGAFMKLRAENRAKDRAWIRNMGAAHQQGQKDQDARHRQALEASRTKAAMSNHPPKGLLGRIGAFFKPRGR